jgi:hypothetical protein
MNCSRQETKKEEATKSFMHREHPSGLMSREKKVSCFRQHFLGNIHGWVTKQSVHFQPLSILPLPSNL